MRSALFGSLALLVTLVRSSHGQDPAPVDPPQASSPKAQRIPLSQRVPKSQQALAELLDSLFREGRNVAEIERLDALPTGSLPSALGTLSSSITGLFAAISLSNSRNRSVPITNHVKANRPSGRLTRGSAGDDPRSRRGSVPLHPLSLDLCDRQAPGAGDLLADGGGVERPAEEEFPPGWTVGALGLGALASERDSESHVGFDSSTAGALFTIDRTWGTTDGMSFEDAVTVGLAGAYSWTEADLDRSAGDATVEAFHIGPYVGIRMGGLYTGLTFLYGHDDFEIHRVISFPGFFREAGSDHDGNEYTSRFDVGYTWDAESWSIGPEASLEHFRLDEESFTESGAGAVNLRVSGRATDSLRTTLGLRYEYRIDLGTDGPKLVPTARAAWVHEYLDEDRDVTAGFVGSPGSFRVEGGEPDRDRARLGAGLRLDWSEVVSGLIDYGAEFAGADSIDHAFSGGVEIRFR